MSCSLLLPARINRRDWLNFPVDSRLLIRAGGSTCLSYSLLVYHIYYLFISFPFLLLILYYSLIYFSYFTFLFFHSHFYYPFYLFFKGTKHIQELVEVSVLEDFALKYSRKMTELTDLITDTILSRLLYDCADSCRSLYG